MKKLLGQFTSYVDRNTKSLSIAAVVMVFLVIAAFILGSATDSRDLAKENRRLNQLTIRLQEQLLAQESDAERDRDRLISHIETLSQQLRDADIEPDVTAEQADAETQGSSRGPSSRGPRGAPGPAGPQGPPGSPSPSHPGTSTTTTTARPSPTTPTTSPCPTVPVAEVCSPV